MAKEKSPRLGARKRFLLEGLQESKNRKRLIAAINNVCKCQNTIRTEWREKKGYRNYYDV